ncbi:MAG TPA: phosphomannomutase [Gammaproteobacteria bacterium]|nr:phosphomannomutase [Gammaproteobacteria bacterium]
MEQTVTAFKAYDVRGRVPEELNEDIAYQIGLAYAQVLKPGKVAVGYDIRQTSPGLARTVSQGLLDAGVDVFDIGMCGTEEIYFSTFHYELDGGIMVTASHNPIEFNGMKFVRANARPLSADTGLNDIRDLVARGGLTAGNHPGALQPLDFRGDYINHLLGYVDVDRLKPLKIVVDPGNGGAGLVIDALESRLPFEFIKIRHEPDGTFPNGVPNPLLEENRHATIEAVKEHGADFGVSWDGDFDRCFLVDADGQFIEGYYLVGLLAEAFLQKHPGARIVHDVRLTWNTIDVVRQHGGEPIESKTGHAFIKDRMRKEDAVYGGEMSGHHYFRDFAYCDSGMIPWLLIAERVSRGGKPLGDMVRERIAAFPCSGEINFRVKDTREAIATLKTRYVNDALRCDETDGVSLEFEQYRFNLRGSNTEPLLRLNVESRGAPALMKQKTEELSEIIRSEC